jgi:uncharacterized membrane protein
MYLNYAHLHLLLNHFPIIGTMVGLALFLVSFVGNNKDLRRAGYIIFAGIALLTIPTFLSGFGAQLGIQGKPNVSDALITRHEASAMLSLWFMFATGGFSFVALWQSHHRARAANWTIAAVLFFSLLTVGLMARTGNTGGDIRHPEDGDFALAQGKVVEGPLGSILSTFEPSPDKFSQLMLSSEWWWGFMMALHFMGLALIVGTVGILDLRVMGFLKQFPVAPLHRFIPWAMTGLAINIVTGCLAFIGQPENYIYSGAFWLKMTALMLLGLNAVVFYMAGIFEHLEKLGPGEDAPAFAKLVAGSSLFLCFALIFLGRYIQPLGDTIRNASK